MNNPVEMSELDTEGSKLLRMIVRAYYPVSFSALVTALLHKVREEGKDNRINEDPIATYMKLNKMQVTKMLMTLAKDLLISHEEIQVERDRTKGATGYAGRNEVRARRMHMWGLDYVSLVNSIRFKHSKILTKLDNSETTASYKCTFVGCPKYNQSIELIDVVVAHERRKINGPKVIDAQMSSQFSLYNSGNTYQSRMSSKRMRNAAMVGMEATDVQMKDQYTENSTGNAFHCPECDHFLVENVVAQDFAEMKRRFNQQIQDINRQLEEVSVLLERERDLKLSNRAGAANSTNKVVGVGARVGCSSTTELASRKEKKKDAMAWDAITEDEKRARLEEEQRRLRQEKDAESQRQRDQERHDKEQRKTEMEKEEQDRRAKEKIMFDVFASDHRAVVADSDTPPADTVTENLKEEDTPTSILGDTSLLSDTTTDNIFEDLDFGGAFDEGFAVDNMEPAVDVMVMVAGVEKPLSEVTDDDLQLMTDEEMEAYEQLMH